MSLIGSVSGFAAFGVLVRTYALGLQKRPVFSSEYSWFYVWNDLYVKTFILQILAAMP
jgi:hypothetical protein